MSDHYIEKCKQCDGVISQCRCPSKDKREIKTRLCDNCLNQERLTQSDTVTIYPRSPLR